MIIKFGSHGFIVKEYKDMLVALGYLYASTHNFFGRDSEKATKAFQVDHGLLVDGIIGKYTSAAILEQYASQNKPNIPVLVQYPDVLTRDTQLQYGSQGSTVKEYKDMLVALGYLAVSTDDIFDRETQKATKSFQFDQHLSVDGIIGVKTSMAILTEYKALNNQSQKIELKKYLTTDQYPHISAKILYEINKALQDETSVRIELVKLDLKWIMPHGLYVFGYNLYTPELKPKEITPDGIRKVAARYPGYYTKGRLDYQLNYIEECAEKKIRLSGCDCSGKEIGLYRKLGIFPPKWDSKAHWLFHSYCSPISKSKLRPGDLLFKRKSSGRIVHVAMYLGSGYISEAVGTAYGIQITDNYQHVVTNHITGKLETHTKFNVFGRPTFIA